MALTKNLLSSARGRHMDVRFHLGLELQNTSFKSTLTLRWQLQGSSSTRIQFDERLRRGSYKEITVRRCGRVCLSRFGKRRGRRIERRPSHARDAFCQAVAASYFEGHK